MCTQDGEIVIQPQPGLYRKVSCSRWDELAESMRWHARTTIALKGHTEFRLLNAPSNGAPQSLLIDGSSNEQQLDLIEKMIKGGPVGGTPLCRALSEVNERG
jgi:hypothetical protein